MISTHVTDRLHLYRRYRLQASFALLGLLVAGLAAAAPQHRASHKLRATALLELTTDRSGIVSTRLVPITILDQGRFRDASVYEARPRPMALDNGVVYEAQHSGVPVGYITVLSGTEDHGQWTAIGKWQPAESEAPAVARKPSTPALSGPTSSGDDRPILHRGSNQPASPPPSSPSGEDRPVLHRGGSSTDQSSDQTSNPPPAQTGAQPRVDTEPDAPPPDDPNRPVLRRRAPKTPTQQPDTLPPPGRDSVSAGPAASNPVPSRPPAGRAVPSRSLPVPTPGVQTLVAISDAQPTIDLRSYEYHWKPEDQTAAEAKLRKLALAQLPRESAGLTENSMTNVVIRSFDLDLSNDAVMVLTAEIPGGYLAPTQSTGGRKTGTAAGRKTTPGQTSNPSSNQTTAPGKFVSRYIALIARLDLEGNPIKLASSVTDSSRLDVAPRLELIDAVDVDGDGLAELLFREYGFDQQSFIIYGVGRGAVTKVFEGASQPVRNSN